MREKFPKLGLPNASTEFFTILAFESCGTLNFTNLNDVFDPVNHLDYLGVQVTWISGPWFLSIFVNMLPWESGEGLCHADFVTFCYLCILISL